MSAQSTERIDVKRPLTVGEVARRSGIAVSALHFYEAQGLISGWRTSGNQRRYARGILRRLGIIKAAQHAGIPLAEIGRALAELPDGRDPTSRDWRRLSRSWKATLDARIESLIRLRDELEGCIGCGCLSMSACPLRNSGDHLNRLGDGAVLLQVARARTARSRIRPPGAARTRPSST